ncbi:hypothetical protein JAAARDRAFT_37220 [Jaapia argillacea MUCL 33604]|uniref:cAMP-independent regulatory protein pac2 n=1 Tax=Jaapia argillacea MUCL 33604 TaxID=933084 RepID=A0A067PZM4_9AGAM|nr:hypothetical protein JAAARDRAFT_37220 [Jaapia argillacea MUCL 33604]
MQKPTLTNIRIRSTHDAHVIFYAAVTGILPLIIRRLDSDERQALRSGCAYAWEERAPQTDVSGLGIERFTEGRKWSASRVRDEFLFYYERWDQPADNRDGRSAPEPPRDWDAMVKQSYSAFINYAPKGIRKMHLTAYFTQRTIDDLCTIDDIPEIRDLQVPEGFIQHNIRTTKNNRGKNAAAAVESTSSTGRHSDTHARQGSSRQYAPYPAPNVAPSQFENQHPSRHENPLPPLQTINYSSGSGVPSSSHYSSPPMSAHSPYSHSHSAPPYSPRHGHSHDRSYSSHQSSQYTLPPPSTMPSPYPAARPAYPSGTGSYSYSNPSSTYGYYTSTSSGPAYTYGSGSSTLSDSPPQSHARSPSISPISASPLAPSEHSQSHSPSSFPSSPSTQPPRSNSSSYGFPSFPSEDGRVRTSPRNSDRVIRPPSQGGMMDVESPRCMLVPLDSLRRDHPYRRDPIDDSALRLLNQKPA